MNKKIKVAGVISFSLISLLVIGFLIINSYRKEILQEINQKLSEEINGDINIGSLRITIFHDFPNVSLSLRNVYLRGPRYVEFHQDFLKAEKINFNVEGMKLFRKKVDIKSVDIINGEIFIFKTRSGYTNLDILKRTLKHDTIQKANLEQVNFKKINLENVSVSFHDSLQRKEFDVRFVNVRSIISPQDSSTLFHLLGKVKFIGLMFNAEKGSYLKNTEAIANFSFEFLPHAHQFVIKPSSLKLEKSDIHLSGLLHLDTLSNFQLQIQADSLFYNEGLSVVTESMRAQLDQFKIEKKVNIKVIVGGSLIPGSKAKVDMTFSVNNSKVSSDKVEMNPLTMSGSLTNHYSDTANIDNVNIMLRLDTLYGKVSGLPFGARALIRNFDKPYLNLKARFDIDINVLNADTLSEVNFKSGRFISDFSYNGLLKEYFDKKIKVYEGELEGVASLTGGEIEYITKRMRFEKVEVLIRFDNKKCQIDNISLSMNKNPIAIKGSFTGFIPFFTQPDKRITGILSVASPRLDIGKLINQKNTLNNSKEDNANKRRKISDLIDQLYKKLEVEMTFNVKQFVHKQFKSENLTGKILLANDRLQVKGMKMKFAEGEIDFSASLNQLQRNVNPFTLTAKVKDADIHKFFNSFNNFNQATIRDENLSGRVDVDILLNSSINNDLDVETTNLKGDVKFQLNDGKLIKFAPLEKVSTFLFKNRDLSNVQFGEINGHFAMKGSELDISRMEIQSTLMTLYLEGRYSLKDSTDLSIQIPLSNLKSRDQEIPPENIGTDKRVGASVYLRARKGKDGVTVISYDPFKKFKKNKKVKRK